MATATTVLQMYVRVVGVIMIVLGLLFWTGNARNLVSVHMLLGITLVLALWALAVLAAVAGVNIGLVVLAFVWGLLVVALGLTQTRLVPGSAHWVIQVLHLLVGLSAIAQAEGIARRIKALRAVALGGAS